MGLEYSYRLFPAHDREVVFPSVSVTVYSPAESELQAKPRKMRTQERHLSVKAVLPEYQRDTWLVAENANISETWNKDLSTLKVGDAFERTIAELPELNPLANLNELIK